MSDAEIKLKRPLAEDGYVVLPIESDDAIVLVPMTPYTAEEYADVLRNEARKARLQRPERVM